MGKQTQREKLSTEFYCRKVSESLGQILIWNTDREFREKCLKLVGSENGMEATEKINELILKAKENNQRKPRKFSKTKNPEKL